MELVNTPVIQFTTHTLFFTGETMRLSLGRAKPQLSLLWQRQLKTEWMVFNEQSTVQEKLLLQKYKHPQITLDMVGLGRTFFALVYKNSLLFLFNLLLSLCLKDKT